jgi:hypothetical protein
MWTTTIIYDANLIRSSDIEVVVSNIAEIQEKLRDLISTDGNGSTLPGYEAPDSLMSVADDVETVEIIREWNQQESAEEFVNFVQQYPWVTASYQAKD